MTGPSTLKRPTDIAKAIAAGYTVEHLVIGKFTVFNETGIIDPSDPAKGYEGNTILILEGIPAAPYTMQAVQIKFADNNKSIPQPNWQQPFLNLEKHWDEYKSIMDMVKRGIENKKPTTSFTATSIVELSQLDIILVI